MRTLAISLIDEGRITTTESKAKELRPYVEKLITAGKKNDLATRRSISSRLGEPKNDTVQKLFGEIAKKYEDREGGYTRIIKLGQTPAGRREAIIEFV